MRAVRLVPVCVFFLIEAALAQDWQGKARMNGRVVDQAGKAIEGVAIKLVHLPSNAGTQATSNNRGQWEVRNIAQGPWLLEFSKPGFDTAQVRVDVGGDPENPNPRVDIKLLPEGTNPVVAIQAADEKGRILIEQQKWPEARAIYEELLRKYPNYPQIFRVHALIAQTYDREGNYDKAAEALKAFLDADPGNVQAKELYGTELAQAGRGEDAWRVLEGLDPAASKDAIRDAGVALLRQKKAAQSMRFFDLLVEKVPSDALAVYYRGFAAWQMVLDSPSKPDTPENKALLDKARADLKRFLTLSPGTKEAANATRILELIK